MSEQLVGPAISWFDLSPLLILLGGALVLLVVGALTPRWPRGCYAAFSASVGGAAMVMSFVLWDDITDQGATHAGAGCDRLRRLRDVRHHRHLHRRGAGRA